MEIKRTEAMEELRLYMVNTKSIYKAYMEIVKEIILSPSQIILKRFRQRMIDVACDAVEMYKREMGVSIGRIGKNQIAAVAMEILSDEVEEYKQFYAQYGHF